MTPVASFDEFVRIRRFPTLDGLRAIAVCGVIWHHTAAPVLGSWAASGELGVDLFFAISGFLITSLLLREHRATGRIDLRAFYVRRSLRIFPIYYVVLATYVVLTLATQRGTPAGQRFLEQLPAFATYTSNWFVDLHAGESVTFYFAWSLATEEQFYLTWPPLLVIVCLGLFRRHATQAGIGVLATAGAISIAANQALSSSAAAGLVWRILASIWIPILCGAMLALLTHRRRSFQALAPLLGRRSSSVALAVVVVAAVALHVPRPVIGVFMALLVAAHGLRVDGIDSHLWQWRPLQAVGRISYGMYLMHMLVANLVRRGVHAQFGLLVFALTAVGVTALAWLSFRYFEAPVMGLATRFGARRPTDAPVEG